MQLRIQNSSKKKFMEEETNVRQIEMKFLDKSSSKQYNQVMEEVQKMMKTNLRKQSRESLFRSKYSTRNMHKDSQNMSNSHHVPKEEDIQRKPKEEEIKSESKIVQHEIVKIPYKFSIKSYFLELFVAYSVTFALLYFIKLANFPYFQLLLIIAFTASVSPWVSSNILMLLAIPMVIGNYFMSLSYFTYPSIAICYFSVLAFNQKHKKKQLFVFVLIFTLIFGFIVLPAVYNSLADSRKLAYIYLFPLLLLLLRTIVSYTYWVIQHTAIVFLQLSLFITGLQYGTILSQDVSTIQFWYLMVFFTLQIMNERTQFILRILVSITEYCFEEKDENKDKKDVKNRVLPAHANGYACIHSFHLFLLVYIYSQLNLYTAPYTTQYSLKLYTTPSYKPVIVWLLSSVYEILSLILQKKSRHKLLYGFTSNKWWRSILRGFMLSLGMWVFYLGLAVGVLVFGTL